MNHQIRVLIADDDELFSETLGLLLNEILHDNFVLDYTVTGKETLDSIYSSNYDLIFLDNKLQDMDGLSILKNMKKNNIKSNVILVTGYSDEELAVKAMKLGAIDYISKGNLDVNRLMISINDLIVNSCNELDIDPAILSEINNLFNSSNELILKHKLGLTSTSDHTLSTQIVKGLTTLVKNKFLERKKIFSLISCPKCGSYANEYYIACPICESKIIETGEVIQHNKCHHIDFRTNFINENSQFICPKCGDELKQIGVDYIKIGVNYKCENSHIFPNLDHKYICYSCENEFSENNASIVHIYNYKILDDGKISINICDSINNDESIQYINNNMT